VHEREIERKFSTKMQVNERKKRKGVGCTSKESE
jgi:hypothetical protein